MHNHLRIGISCDAPKRPGGTERYALDIAQGLAQLAHVVLFAPRFAPLLRDRDTHAIQTWQIANRFVPKPWRKALFSRRLHAARQQANLDVLIGCNRVDCADMLMCGGTHKGFLAAMGKTATRKDTREIAQESRAYAHASVIIAHSRLMQRELTTLYGLDAAKVRVLHPPVDTTRFGSPTPAQRLALRQQYGFGAEDTVLFFPSNSHARKGLALIVRALEKLRLPNVVLLVAGSPTRQQAPFIRHLGYVHNIASCYQAADYTILAPLYEPFGLVGVESVLCGTPVIFPTNVGCTEVLTPAACTLFEPSSLDSLCTVLEQLCAERERERERETINACRACCWITIAASRHTCRPCLRWQGDRDKTALGKPQAACPPFIFKTRRFLRP